MLEDFQQRLCVQNPYSRSTADRKEILGTGVAVGTAKRMTRELGRFAERFRLLGLTDEEVPVLEAEAEILVVAADGKGVVMRKTLAEHLQEEKHASAGSDTSDVLCSGNANSPPASSSEVSSSGVEPSDEATQKRPRRKARWKEQKRWAAARRRGKGKASPACALHADRRKDSDNASAASSRKSRKQMAYVGAVYTLAPFVRTPIKS